MSNDTFTLRILEGGKLLEDNKSILIGDLNRCDSVLKIEFGFTNDVRKSKTFSFKIEKQNKQNITVKDFVTQTETLNIYVNLELKTNECSNQKYISVKIYDLNDNLIKSTTINIYKGVLAIDVSGHNGKNGKNGTRNYIDGGNGTDGEDGGDVVIYYTAAVKPYLSKIIIINNGGKGGRYGKEGKGCRVDIHHNDEERTIYGKNCIPGRDGRDDRTGTINFVLISE